MCELRDGSLKSAGPGSCNWWKSAAMASTLPSSNLIELYDTEHLGVTGHGKSQPQQYPGRENQSAKGSRNYFNVGSLALVCHSIGNTGLTPGAIGAPPSNLHSDAFAIQPLGAFGGSEISGAPTRTRQSSPKPERQRSTSPSAHRGR